jgi:hypothetical protein
MVSISRLTTVLTSRACALIVAGVAALGLARAAEAVNVQATAFFAACPGPIAVTTDTTIRGSATVAGDCTLSVSPDVQLQLAQVRLTFGGAFMILGNAALTSIGGSRIEAGTDLTVDALNRTVVQNSVLIAGQALTIATRTETTIAGSELQASSVTVGGRGSATLQDCGITASGDVRMALAAPGDLALKNCRIDAETLLLGGQGPLLVDGCTLHATGASPVFGSAVLTIGPGEVSGVGSDVTLHRTTLIADVGELLIGGAGNVFVKDSTLSLGTLVGPGITIGPRTDVSILDSVVSAPFGPVTIVGGNDTTVTRSELRAGQGQLTLGRRNTATITNSRLNVRDGDMVIVGFMDNVITNSTLAAQNGEIIISQGQDAAVTRGALRGDNGIEITSGGGSTVSAAEVSGDGFEFLVYSGPGADSVIDRNQITAHELTVGAFGNTTVRRNTLLVSGPVDISAAGLCIVVSNSPNVTCQ